MFSLPVKMLTCTISGHFQHVSFPDEPGSGDSSHSPPHFWRRTWSIKWHRFFTDLLPFMSRMHWTVKRNSKGLTPSVENSLLISSFVCPLFYSLTEGPLLPLCLLSYVSMYPLLLLDKVPQLTIFLAVLTDSMCLPIVACKWCFL